MPVPLHDDKQVIQSEPEPVAHAVPDVLKHADHNDADEALTAVAALEGSALLLDADAERRLLRKIDWHLMPVLCVVYGLNYLDKTTLSYARSVCLCEWCLRSG